MTRDRDEDAVSPNPLKSIDVSPQDQGVPASPSGCQPSASAPLSGGSSQSGIPNAGAFLALAERVEALTGPDREVEWRIWIAGHAPEANLEGNGSDRPYQVRLGGSPLGGGKIINFEGNAACAPLFTSSLDDALTLVPDGWEAAIYCAPAGAAGVNANVQMETEEMRRQDPFFPVDSIAPTPPLALTAACLRARAASVDTLPKGQDSATGLVRSKGSAVPEGQTPNLSAKSLKGNNHA